MASYYQSFGSWGRTYNSLKATTICMCCDQSGNGSGSSASCSGNGSVLADFPSGITSCAQAVQIIAEEIKQRIAATSVTVQAGSATAFILLYQLSTVGGDTASVQLQVGGGCTYPIGVRWSRPRRFSSGLSSFGTKQALVDYLVRQLRR